MSFVIGYKERHLPLSDWGLSELKRRRINQGVDKVIIEESEPDMAQGPQFEPESTLSIYKEGKRWFEGIVTQVPGYSTAKGDKRIYEVSGPWWYLQNLIYQQGWKQVTPLEEDKVKTEKIDTGRVILGQNAQGNPMSNGKQIEEVLRYAIEQGAPISVGTIGVRAMFPYDETRDISCAEAIVRLLRWTPDAVVWFNYAKDGRPEINITRRQDMEVHEVKEGIKKINYTPRHDMVSPGVVIKYEKNHVHDGHSWTTTEVDAYPRGIDGKEFKTLILTVELDGSRTQHVTQEVKTRPIRVNNASWWKQHLPGLEGVPSGDIMITGATRSSALPVELIEGGVSKWMEKKIEEDVVKAKISYETADERVVEREVAVKLHATDARTEVYTRTLSTVGAERTPRGLAKQLYEAVKELHYDGEVVLMGHYDVLGKLIRLQGVDGVVQRVEENVKKGETRVVFGPAKHMGVGDLVELLRVNRKRRASRSAGRRISGRSGAGVIEQPTHGRMENSGVGSGGWGKMVFKHPRESGRRMVLDASKMHVDTQVELVEEDVCENGILKKRMVLASAPYVQEGAL